MAEPARPEVQDDYLAQLEDHLNCRRYDKAQRMVRSSAIVKMASEEVARKAKMQKCEKPDKLGKRVRFADGSTPADRVHKQRLNDLERALWSAKKRGYRTTQARRRRRRRRPRRRRPRRRPRRPSRSSASRTSPSGWATDH